MQTIPIPEGIAVRNGVNLNDRGENEVRTVLVKFRFTNPGLIPSGIPERKVSDQKARQIDDFNAIVAKGQGKSYLAEVGRIRPGRVDTGVQTVNNLQSVQVGLIRRGLTNVGFQLRGVDVLRLEGKSRVVCLIFERGGYYEEATATEEEKAAHKLLSSPQVVEAIRALANTTWQWCHVWDNSQTRNTATINLGGRLPEVKPYHAIAVRKGEIVPVKLYFSVNLKEDEE